MLGRGGASRTPKKDFGGDVLSANVIRHVRVVSQNGCGGRSQR